MNIINGGISTDDRGTVRFVNDFTFENVKRFYQVQNHQAGFIRAWHGHEFESKFVYVAQGSALVSAVPLEIMRSETYDPSTIFKTVLSSNNPKILYIPKGYANGFKTLSDDTILLFFSTSTLQESINDDIRFDYNHIDIWKENYR